MDSTNVPAADRNGQLIVSCSTVGVLGLLGVGLLVVIYQQAGLAASGFVAFGTIIGILGNSLNSPSGIGNVIRSAVTGPKEGSAPPTLLSAASEPPK